MSIVRKSPAEVTDGLTSKSDKIRALARADYSRVEIAALLGIRYQHVRKVLLDAGISSGLKEIELEVDQSPVIVEQTSDEREPAKVEFLTGAGFHILGKWSQPQPGEIALDADAPKQPGVYAFVLDEVVVYVGLTQSTLKTRLDQYRRGYEGQRTNVRVKGLISDALAAGRIVQVLVAVPEQLEWNGLPVNTVAGLEMGLIKLLKPAWNILGAA
ncbi:GIY-YIG nuclease family protein [Afipia sp. TerB]